MSSLYIHRKLHWCERLIQDDELLEKSGVFVVLAEPGAGKSDLLDYYGKSHGVPREPASLFVHRTPSNPPVLIIDALDEVARISEDKINEIIVKARALGADKVIFASRSYIWDEARTRIVRDCFGIDPTILRLEPFDDDEQRQLFNSYVPGEDFDRFRTEADRLELTPILGNPQFLKLFADAYVEGGRHFVSKRQIYADALRRLASESKDTAGLGDRPQTGTILAAAGEMFAKLLLSGAAGVSAREDIGDDAYPYLRAVGPDDRVVIFALNTRLFKPTSSVNRHDPVHRIVAEYCAADYLVRRIQDPTNTLSIRRCLAVIAPNGTARNELRGMIGWMASLGGRTMQEVIVDLDPYAVLANGDASQLLAASKQRLLKGLEALSKIDPFFRRMDSWRRFNVAGFFSSDMTEHVRPLLTPAHAQSHLRGLLLQLLQGTDAATGLEQEFRAILHDTHAQMTEREQAYRNLEEIPGSDLVGDFDVLVGQASRDSLEMASEMIEKQGPGRFGRARAFRLVNALAELYPADGVRQRTIGSLYFIRSLIGTFELDDTRYLLDEITRALRCVCGKEKPRRCTCRKGRSKIAGHLLDRYFETMVGPHDPAQIGRWTKPLVFSGYFKSERSASVQAMSENNGLRRAIQIAAFDGLSTQKEIGEASTQFYTGFGHAGLSLHEGDYRAIVDHAIATGNDALWENFIVRHSPYNQRKGPDELRAHMRAQARQSDDLLRIWTRVDRNSRDQFRRDFVSFGRSNKRYEQMEAENKERRLEQLQQNRAQIEAGQHFGWLRLFSEHYLYRPNKTENFVADPQFVERALLNCFDFLAPDVPSLEMLAERRGTAIAMVLHAACLATFRQKGSLEGIALNILQAVKTDGISGPGYEEGEAERLEAALDKRLFPSDAEAVAFARRYLEPQLALTGDSATRIHILDHGSAFSRVKGQLAVEWLKRYPDMPFHTRETLFGIAAAHADRAQLNAVIETHCSSPVDGSEAARNRRRFWLLRHFFFIVPTSDALWAEFSADPKSIFAIEQYSGRFSRHDAQGWPQLNAEKLFRILDAFVAVWPKVDLPDSYGTGDPEDETAYRFLKDAVFHIERDDPSNSIPVFDRILSDIRFADFHNSARSLKAIAVRQLALSGFQTPSPADISRLLDENKIASVEDMRAVLIELLDEIQGRLKGAATNPVDVFYSGGDRIDENTARNRIVDMLEARLNALHLGVVIEHQMADAKRCDFTASTTINGSPIVLVTEVKGQWNAELYTAASAQLTERYTIYPGAADQGVYLVLWFGAGETVAGKKAPAITSADELRREIIAQMPDNVTGRIDVYVLDVSREKNAKSNN
jgi:hypothetical protein